MVKVDFDGSTLATPNSAVILNNLNTMYPTLGYEVSYFL